MGLKGFAWSAAIALGAMTALAPAQAQTSTTLKLYDIDPTGGEHLGTYAEGGYSIELASHNGTGVWVQPGTDLEPRLPVSGGQVNVTNTAGSLFDFDSIDARNYEGAASLTVAGYLNGTLIGTDIFQPTSSGLTTFAAYGALADATLSELSITGTWDYTNEVGFANLVVSPASVAAAPEPATWVMMILGFGLVGGVLRRAYRRSEERFTAKVRSLATA